MNKERLVIWFDELQLKDIPEVGGKNASLGEMRQNLQKKGVNIPDGYAVTAQAYRHLIQSAGIWDNIKEILKDLDTHDMHNLKTRGKKVRDLIYNAPVPKDLRDEIVKAYRKLCDEYGPNTDVAVRSSATAEDLPDASFAGPAGDLPEHPGRGGPHRRLQALFCVALHGPGHLLPLRQGFRLRDGLPVHRCAEDGAFRHRRPRASSSPSTRNRASRMSS